MAQPEKGSKVGKGPRNDPVEAAYPSFQDFFLLGAAMDCLNSLKAEIPDGMPFKVDLFSYRINERDLDGRIGNFQGYSRKSRS